jgi:hypothetical protein
MSGLNAIPPNGPAPYAAGNNTPKYAKVDRNGNLVGANAVNVQSVATNTTLTRTGNFQYIVLGANSLTLTLPPARNNPTVYTFLPPSNNTGWFATLVPSGSDTINNTTSHFTTTNPDTVIVSDQVSNYIVVTQ